MGKEKGERKKVAVLIDQRLTFGREKAIESTEPLINGDVWWVEIERLLNARSEVKLWVE